jgi:hypothetical protein
VLVGVDEGVDAELGAAAAEGRRARDLAAQPGALRYARTAAPFRTIYPKASHSAYAALLLPHYSRVHAAQPEPSNRLPTS